MSTSTNKTAKYTPRLKQQYEKNIVPALQKKYSYTSTMEVPRMKKICLNQGLGIAVSDRKLAEAAVNEMTAITGQKAVTAKSKKDIANFKLRKGVAVGCRVTLRGDNMYDFLDRLISAALPRIRDFKGIERKGFDGFGNYTLGITEQIIFPEIVMDKVSKIMGMDITFVTSAGTDDEAFALLEAFGMPFKKLNTEE
ncbi:MAG TPA: 50S ribosomal protein L5 [Bacteroidia bacterium]|nr:50S ribosomal protein L5 [Bacteroidia bacterium]